MTTMQLKHDFAAVGQLEELLFKFGPAQVVEALKDNLTGWAEVARDGLYLDDEKAIEAADAEAAQLLQAADALDAALTAIRALGL